MRKNMNNTPLMKEDHTSQIPALELLIKMGYEYLTPEQALIERSEKTSGVILEEILEKQLRKINNIQYKGETYSFSNNNINSAITALKNIPFEGLIKTSEKVYDLLTLGKSFEENIKGNTTSFTLNYIDWKNIKNNVFHVTEEFEVEKTASKEIGRAHV